MDARLVGGADVAARADRPRRRGPRAAAQRGGPRRRARAPAGRSDRRRRGGARGFGARGRRVPPDRRGRTRDQGVGGRGALRVVRGGGERSVPRHPCRRAGVRGAARGAGAAVQPDALGAADRDRQDPADRDVVADPDRGAGRREPAPLERERARRAPGFGGRDRRDGARGSRAADERRVRGRGRPAGQASRAGAGAAGGRGARARRRPVYRQDGHAHGGPTGRRRGRAARRGRGAPGRARGARRGRTPPERHPPRDPRELRRCPGRMARRLDRPVLVRPQVERCRLRDQGDVGARSARRTPELAGRRRPPREGARARRGGTARGPPRPHRVHDRNRSRTGTTRPRRLRDPDRPGSGDGIDHARVLRPARRERQGHQRRPSRDRRRGRARGWVCRAPTPRSTRRRSRKAARSSPRCSRRTRSSGV